MMHQWNSMICLNDKRVRSRVKSKKEKYIYISVQYMTCIFLEQVCNGLSWHTLQTTWISPCITVADDDFTLPFPSERVLLFVPVLSASIKASSMRPIISSPER